MSAIDPTLSYRVNELEKDVSVLNKKLDRLIWSIVALTITIASSAIVFAFTILSTQRVG